MTAGKITVIGAGTIGSALAKSLLRNGHPAADLVLTARRAAQVGRLRAELDVPVTQDNPAAVADADVVVLATKPQDLTTVLDEIAAAAQSRRPIVVSLAAGVSTDSICDRLGAQLAVVRVMTNTALLVGAAMSVLSPGRHATEADLAEVTAIMASAGAVMTLEEGQQDAVSALSGHGAAYLYFLVEVLTQAGVYAGVAGPVARELLVQTMAGAAAMLQSTGEHPLVLREAVMSRGGATISAFRELERHNVRDALFDAVVAATRRGAELGRLMP